MTNQDVSADDRLLELAQEIKAEKGVPLIEAMDIAESRMAGGPDIQTEFTITIKLKPRIARWVIEVFGGHEKFSVEERVAAYLTPYLAQARIGIIREEQDKGRKITEGTAVTIRRHNLEDAK